MYIYEILFVRGIYYRIDKIYYDDNICMHAHVTVN